MARKWFGRSPSLRLQLREQDHVADAFLAEESRGCGTQAVNADADAARRRHAVFECDESRRAGFVQLVLLAAGPAIAGFQRGALRDGIILLGVAGRNLLAVDAALEGFDGRRAFAAPKRLRPDRGGVGLAPAGLASGTSSLS